MKCLIALAAVLALAPIATAQNTPKPSKPATVTVQDSNTSSYVVSVTITPRDYKTAQVKVLFGTQPSWTIDTRKGVTFDGVAYKTLGPLLVKIMETPHVRVEIADDGTGIVGAAFKSAPKPPAITGGIGPQRIDK